MRFSLYALGSIMFFSMHVHSAAPRHTAVVPGGAPWWVLSNGG